MAKRQRSAPARPPSRRRLSRWQRERRLQRLVIIAGAIVLALVMAIPAYGYYQEYFARGQQPVIAVNGQTRSMNDYVHALAYRSFLLDLQESMLRNLAAGPGTSDSEKAMAGLAGQQLQQVAMQRQLLTMQTAEDMIDDDLVRQGAAKLGVGTNPEEVDQALRDMLVPPPQEGEQVDEAQRQSDFASRYSSVLSGSGIANADYRYQVESEVLRRKLDEYLRNQVSNIAEQVHVQAILLDKADESQEVRSQLETGQDFTALAQEKTQDTIAKEKGGDLGWIPRGLEEPEFDEVAFTLPLGELSQPVQTNLGYYIIKVLDKSTRELDADKLDQLKGRAFDQWLEQQKASSQIERYISSDKQQWAMDQVAKLQKRSQTTR